MPDSHHAVKSSLSFAKLVATPNETGWAQVYNAGNLFACLSLSVTEPVEALTLQSVGKDVFNLLQSEFFSLEEKNADTIKEAITVSLGKVPEGVHVDLTLANFKENILSVFIAGSGKVVLKRGDKIGVLIEKKAVYDETISSATGQVQNGDTLVLQTGHFAKGIPHEAVVGAFELALPTDIVEALSPQVLEQNNGAQAAIVIVYHAAGPQHIETGPEEKLEEPTLASVTEEEAEMTELRNEEEEDAAENKKHFMPSLPSFAFPKGLTSLHLSHKRKLYLTIAVILAFLLVTSIFLAVKKQNDEKQKALFTTIYTQAQQYYEEGQGLESLNKSLSQESYMKAENKLKEGEGKISKGSDEDKQIQELLAKIESAKQGASIGEASDAKQSQPPSNSLLAVAKATSDAKGFGQDSNTVFLVTDTVASSVAKGSGSKKELVKNNNAWTSPQAIVPYQANFYILDQKNGVLKFVPSGSTYSKSSYFSGTAPDLSNATGMAIDSSIWIVTKDGKILKYTRGQKDSFSLTGFDKPLKNPTKIFTSSAIDSVYVMDNGNSRVVQFDKKGAYQNAFTSSVIASAKEFDVLESSKKILILSGGNVYELPL